jgi:hypothetical protein
MKYKLVGIFICMLLIGMVIPVGGNVISKEISKQGLIKTGTFKAEIYDEGQTIGNTSGKYIFIEVIKDGLTIIRFKGYWNITSGAYAGTKGTVFGIGGMHIQIGRITFDRASKILPFISNLAFTKSIFAGDFILFFGPSLYVGYGNYQEE